MRERERGGRAGEMDCEGRTDRTCDCPKAKDKATRGLKITPKFQAKTFRATNRRRSSRINCTELINQQREKRTLSRWK